METCLDDQLKKHEETKVEEVQQKAKLSRIEHDKGIQQHHFENSIR